MSEWAKVTLGEVMVLEVNRVDVAPQETYDIVGVLNRGRGLLCREPMRGSETKYKTLIQVGPDQVVYSRLKAFEGAITVAPERVGPVYASQEFPTFTCSPDLVPGYFRLLTTTKALWDRLQNLSTGMGGRRERVKPHDFLTIPLALPSIAEQRRIIDVMSAVDAQIEALEEEVEGADRAWLAAVASLDAVETRVALGEVLDAIEAGKSPKGVERPPGPDERAVLKISAIGRARFNPAEVKTVAPEVDLKESSRIRKGDVLLVRCNAVLDRVGVVCQVPEEPRNLYLCDKTLRLVPRSDSVAPNYLASVMAAPSVRGDIEARTAGSDMRNIGQKSLREVRVPLPSMDEQIKRGTALTSMIQGGIALRDELDRLRMFRSVLLPSLLNQEIEIPASYDRLLEVAG